MAIPDIYTEGIASGWKVIDAAKLTAPWPPRSWLSPD